MQYKLSMVGLSRTSSRFRGQNTMPPTHEKLCNHNAIVADNSVKYVSPDGFYGIHLLPNSISGGDPTPLGELMTMK